MTRHEVRHCGEQMWQNAPGPAMPNATFGPFQLDLETGELHRSGIAVRLQPQPAKLLVLLVRRAGELVMRDEIRHRVWGSDTFVDFDQSVNFCVRQIRTALHDDASTPCYLETVPRRGYRFIAPVHHTAEDAGMPARPPAGAVPAVRLQRMSIAAAAVLALAVAVAAIAAFRHSPAGQAVARDLPVASPAQEHVALGRFFLNKHSADGAQRAVEHFEAAIRIDPASAPAHAGLADAYNQLAGVYIAARPPTEVRLLALRAATRAIHLDPTSAEAYTALGYASMHEMDWQRAGAALRRAIEANPRYGPAHQTYAAYLANQRRFAESIEEARLALELEPASLPARQTYAWMLYFDRQYDAALRELQTIAEMDPGYTSVHFFIGEALLVMGRAADAIRELETAVALTDRAPAPLGLLAMAFGASGKRGEAQRIVEELEARSAAQNVPPGALLLAYIGVGDTSRAVDMLARGYEERDNYEINIDSDPLMDPLRTDPRFLELCRRVMQGSGRDWSAAQPRVPPPTRP
jgi:DNA-binding winged helix-turn-helix (wHTH) protein/Flp pilus assembly protein TadD